MSCLDEMSHYTDPSSLHWPELHFSDSFRSFFLSHEPRSQAGMEDFTAIINIIKCL